jgi:hypothetical protein
MLSSSFRRAISVRDGSRSASNRAGRDRLVDAFAQAAVNAVNASEIEWSTADRTNVVH